MGSSPTRLDRYAAIAACGSGAVGLAVSPLHADIRYFGSEFTFSLSDAWNTSEYGFQTISGGGVAWALRYHRSARGSSRTHYSQWGGGTFSYARAVNSTSVRGWSAYGAMDQAVLLNAGDLIDSAILSSDGGWCNLHYGYRFYNYNFSSVSYGDGHLYTSIRGGEHTTSYGPLASGERAFLALGFRTYDQPLLMGWADISLSTDGLSLTVHGWAFEDSGAGIVAGETGASNPVPGLGGLAALACGAAGLRRKRDRVA